MQELQIHDGQELGLSTSLVPIVLALRSTWTVRLSLSSRWIETAAAGREVDEPMISYARSWGREDIPRWLVNGFRETAKLKLVPSKDSRDGKNKLSINADKRQLAWARRDRKAGKLLGGFMLRGTPQT